MRAVLIWAGVAAACVVPIMAAAFSPLLAWRDPIYIAAGFSGIIGMALILLQPLLAAGYLPGLTMMRARWLHRRIGVALIVLVVLHVVGLWLTSPPDVIDALMLRSPTPFSIWGVIAMWALFAAAALMALRRRLGLRPRHWRIGHTALVCVVALSSVAHAMLIDGTMELISKTAQCLLVIVVLVHVARGLRAWGRRTPQR